MWITLTVVILVATACSTDGAFEPEVSVRPAARGYHSMLGLGPERGVMLLAGQTASPPAGGEELDDTWTYDQSDGWLAVTTGAPWGDAVAYDARANRAVVFSEGGTWIFDPATNRWSKQENAAPGAVFGARAAYDVGSDRTILFDGDGRTWAYDLGTDTWTEMAPAVSPSPRLWYVMDYQQGSDRIVLFGGISAGQQYSGDTWIYHYDSDTWTEIYPTTSPNARSYSAMAYDPGTDRLILFGGVTGPVRAERVFGDTWAYDVETNTWTELAPAPAPSGRGWHAIAYDAGGGVIVLFGGGPTRDDVVAETWIYDPAANAWTEVG
jgi:N-acetylneuraminic acid mutarotase